jgi:hypothetical protein
VPKRLIFLCILPLFLSTGAVAQPATPPEATLWDHNGSVVYLIANGSSREFYCKQPRSGMLEAGARPGSLLFHGRSIKCRLARLTLARTISVAVYRLFFDRYPDGKFENLKVVVAGEIGTFEWDFVATDSGGQTVRIAGCDLLQFVGDKVAVE